MTRTKTLMLWLLSSWIIFFSVGSSLSVLYVLPFIAGLMIGISWLRKDCVPDGGIASLVLLAISCLWSGHAPTLTTALVALGLLWLGIWVGLDVLSAFMAVPLSASRFRVTLLVGGVLAAFVTIHKIVETDLLTIFRYTIPEERAVSAREGLLFLPPEAHTQALLQAAAGQVRENHRAGARTTLRRAASVAAEGYVGNREYLLMDIAAAQVMAGFSDDAAQTVPDTGKLAMTVYQKYMALKDVANARTWIPRMSSEYARGDAMAQILEGELQERQRAEAAQIIAEIREMFDGKHANVNYGRLSIAMSQAGFPQDADGFANQNISDPHQLQEILRSVSPTLADSGQGQPTNISAAQEDYTFEADPKDEHRSAHPGEVVGWGYALHNQSKRYWLQPTALNPDAVAFAQPNALFDFPAVSPGGTVAKKYDKGRKEGLYEIALSRSIQLGYVNFGRLTLVSEWWDNNPINGGKKISPAPEHVATYFVIAQ